MLQGLLHLHSALRYLIVLLMIVSLIVAFYGWFGNKNFLKSHKKTHLFTHMFLNVQLILGLALYFMKGYHHMFSNISQLPDLARFYAMEHMSAMIIAVILFNIGYHRARKATLDKSKHMRIAIFFGIGFLIVMAMIPWPFMYSWATWF